MSTHDPRGIKDDFRRRSPEIRRVLLEVWDPIGVRDEPYAQDEYDGYIGQIYKLLFNRATDLEIAEYLCWIVRDYIGLGPASVAEMAPTIQALRAIPVLSCEGAPPETGGAR